MAKKGAVGAREPALAEDAQRNATQLLEATLDGDVRVLQLLQSGVDPNFVTADGFSPLIYAAKGGHLQIVEALLSAGAHANPRDHASHTAIRAASLYGHVDVVYLLLAAGADPNHTSAGGKTALMGAFMNGHVEVARVLLAAGANADAINDFGESAAALAEANGHVGDTDCRPLLAQFCDRRVRPPDRPFVDPTEVILRVGYMCAGVAFLVLVGLLCRHIDGKLVPPKEEL